MAEPWGPHNPHPLSTRRTELIWEGKYDEYGNRRELDLASLAFPLQPFETVATPCRRAEQPGIQRPAAELADEFHNLLVWGDNRLVMASLLDRFVGQIDLIYIDPPFAVGADFAAQVDLGDNGSAVCQELSSVATIAYRDTWGPGLDSYAQFLFERLSLMRLLLRDSGSIFVHVDYRVQHLVRCLLDEVFGADRCLNEVIWSYSTSGRPVDRFPQKHDNLYWYAKGESHRFYPEQVRVPYSEEYLRTHFTETDEQGRRCRRRFDAGKWRTYYPEDGMVPNAVWDIPYVNSQALDRTGYPTQKPTELLERIVQCATLPGDLVADFFCGSGTTLAVAEKLGRRWIGCDLGRFAIHTTRKRLIGVQRELHAAGRPYRSFDVYNLGRYERQWWQRERLRGADDEHRRTVLQFFHAEPLASPPSPLLHGRKGQELVHVDAIDGLFTQEELKAVVAAAVGVGVKKLACLAWEFEMNLRLRASELEQTTGLAIRLLQIPREILTLNRSAGPPPFIELGYLRAEPVYRVVGAERRVDIKLIEFFPPLTEERRQQLDGPDRRPAEWGFDFIDLWTVDFTFAADRPFYHHWQAYRTRRQRQLPTESDCGFEYPGFGTYTACVKVFDVFGVETSALVEVAPTEFSALSSGVRPGS